LRDTVPRSKCFAQIQPLIHVSRCVKYAPRTRGVELSVFTLTTRYQHLTCSHCDGGAPTRSADDLDDAIPPAPSATRTSASLAPLSTGVRTAANHSIGGRRCGGITAALRPPSARDNATVKIRCQGPSRLPRKGARFHCPAGRRGGDRTAWEACLSPTPELRHRERKSMKIGRYVRGNSRRRFAREG
jgi:hypothetical protein